MSHLEQSVCMVALLEAKDKSMHVISWTMNSFLLEYVERAEYSLLLHVVLNLVDASCMEAK